VATNDTEPLAVVVALGMSPMPAIASTPATSSPWWRWWTIAAGWWLLNGVITGLARTRGGPLGYLPLAQDLLSALLWIPVTVLAFWLADRKPVHRATWRHHVPWALVAAAAVVVLRALFVLSTDRWLHWYPSPPVASDVFVRSLANNFLPFFLLLGAAHALVYAQRIRERDELLARVELQHLKAQLQPHFLFNALNAISTSVHEDPERAVQMIERLSLLLRRALQQASVQEVALEEELAVVGAYVDLEQLRFEERLHVTWDIDPLVRTALVPHLLLQPLVENAIRHGVGPRREGGTVHVRAARVGDRLRLVVGDDGVGLRTDAVTGTQGAGIGLRNVRARLRQLYGNAHAFTFRERSPRGLDVEIELPFRLGSAHG
jgi:two-component system, LytTR family, sensor kinase